VFGPGSDTGLPLNETTVADQVKKAGYKTAIMGKVSGSACWSQARER
jgi:arylsulfatase A-like enzyme